MSKGAKPEVEVLHWGVGQVEGFDFHEPTEGPMSGKLVATPKGIHVDLRMRMSRRAYEAFRDMMQRNFGAQESGTKRPALPDPTRQLPKASPKLPEHDVIDAEFVEVSPEVK